MILLEPIGYLTHQQLNIKQDRQFTYNVSLRRVHVTIGAIEKQ